MPNIFNRPMFKLGGAPNSDGVGITSGFQRPGYKNSNYRKEHEKYSLEALKGMDKMGKVGTPEMAMMLSNVLGQGGSIYDMITNAQTEVMPKYANYKKIQSQLPGAKASIYQGLAEGELAERALDVKEDYYKGVVGKKLLPEVKEDMLTKLQVWKVDKVDEGGKWKNPDDYVEYQVRMNIIDSGFLTDNEARVEAGKIVRGLEAFQDAGPSKANRMIKAWVEFLTGRADSVDYRVPEAEGGRVGYNMGMGPAMDQQTQAIDIQTPTGNEEMVATETMQAPNPSNDPFVLLRARLPKEITDDVVKLIAYNPEAFKDFAAIENQQDVINFNQTYGVELVIPTAQA